MILLLTWLSLASPARELRASHVTLSTDLADADARRLLQATETIIVETQALVQGYVKNDFLGMLSLATSGEEPAVHVEGGVVRVNVRPSLDADSQRLLRQGVAERVLQTDVLASQPWAMKGIAAYVSTAARAGGELRAGIPPPDFVFFNSEVAAPNGPAWIDARELPSLAQLLAATGKDFVDDKRGHLFAAGAWMLVAVLQDARLPYAAVLSRFTFALRCGTPAAEAWTHALGTHAATIEKDYREQVVRHGAAVSTRPAPHTADVPAGTHVADVPTETPDTLLAAARDALKAGNPADALPLIEKAARWQPGSVRCLDTLGFTYFALHRAPEAELAQARAAALTPDPAVAERLAKYRGLRESLGQKPLDACAR